jgi:hypothetical protein
MSFIFLVDEQNKVLMVRFASAFTDEVLGAFIAAGPAFVSRHGNWPSIIDFSGVSEVRVELKHIRALGQSPRLMKGVARILVAPQDELFGMLRMYGLHQAGLGDEPVVVRSLHEAYATLGLNNPDFLRLSED